MILGPSIAQVNHEHGIHNNNYQIFLSSIHLICWLKRNSIPKYFPKRYLIVNVELPSIHQEHWSDVHIRRCLNIRGLISIYKVEMGLGYCVNSTRYFISFVKLIVGLKIIVHYYFIATIHISNNKWYILFKENKNVH